MLLVLCVACGSCGGGSPPDGGTSGDSDMGCTGAQGQCLATGTVCMGQNVGAKDCGYYRFCCMLGGH